MKRLPRRVVLALGVSVFALSIAGADRIPLLEAQDPTALPAAVRWLRERGLGTLGHGPLALRLPSAIALTFAALACCAVAGRMDARPRVATTAAGLLATCALAAVAGHAATADGLVLAAQSCTVWLLCRIGRPHPLAVALAVPAATGVVGWGGAAPGLPALSTLATGLAALALGLLPWAPLLALGAPRLAARDPSARVLGAWLLGAGAAALLAPAPPVLRFLPCVPPLAIAVALGAESAPPWRQRQARWGLCLSAPVLALAAPAAAAALEAGAAVVPAAVGGAVLATAALVAARDLAHGRALAALAACILGGALGLGVLLSRAVPAAAPQLLSGAFEQDLPRVVPRGDSVSVLGAALPGAAFALQRAVPTLALTHPEFALALLGEKDRWLLVDARDVDALRRCAASANNALPSPRWVGAGYDASAGRWREVWLFASSSAR